jgi:hypothetical protein
VLLSPLQARGHHHRSSGPPARHYHHRLAKSLGLVWRSLFLSLCSAAPSNNRHSASHSQFIHINMAASPLVIESIVAVVICLVCASLASGLTQVMSIQRLAVSCLPRKSSC